MPDFRFFKNDFSLVKNEFKRSIARGSEENKKEFCAWCHGASGNGLGRLRAFQLTGEKRYLYWVKRSLKKTKETLSDNSSVKKCTFLYKLF